MPVMPPVQTAKTLTGARPSQVPADAEWLFDTEEWLVCARDARGELHGSLRSYRADGTASIEYEYRHGKRHGPFRRFHPSGELARHGRYFDDLLDGLLVVLSDGDDPFSIRECCIPAGARVMKQEHRRGQLLAESFYDARGNRVLEPGADASTWPEPLRDREEDLLAAEYAFWPAREPLFTPETEEEVRVEQSTVSLCDAIGRAAQRLMSVRGELMRQGLAPLPPDLSWLTDGAAATLRRFAFDTDEEEPSLVQVDETLSVTGLDARALRLRARLEWTTLCWLCWAAGLDRVALPTRIQPRPELYAALLVSSARQAALTGPELAPDADPHFHRLNETLLPAAALAHLADQYREARAALLFVSDPTCRTPWQDDLGRDAPSA